MGRILAIDFGLRRIGLAVSDPLGITAQGLDTLASKGRTKDLETLARLADQYEVEQIIVGHPLHLKGGATSMSEKIEQFAKELEKRTGRSVELCDERLTTAEAETSLREMGTRRAKGRKAVDRIAATLLLQSYLDRLTLKRGPLEQQHFPGNGGGNL